MAPHPKPKLIVPFSPLESVSSHESSVFANDELPNFNDGELFQNAQTLNDTDQKNKRSVFSFDTLFKPPEKFGKLPSLQASDEKEDYTMLLPDDCLATVFQKLDDKDAVSCNQVCRRWYRVEAETRSHLILKANVDMSPIIPKLLNRFVSITKLVLKCDKNMVSIDNDTLVTIANGCRFLRKLKLKNCKMVTDEGMQRFSLACPNLQKFSCVSCGFGARGLNFLLSHCKFLEDLTVKRSVRSSGDKTPEAICPGYGSLKRLCIKYQGSADIWTPLIRDSNRLETLIVAKNRGYWDPVFRDAFSPSKPSLAQVYIEDIKVTDHGLGSLALCNNLQALVIVQAGQCTHVGLSAIAAGCPGLKRLHVERWSPNQIPDIGFKSIANHCKDLQELVIVGFSVTCAGLVPLATKSLNLERLTICTSDTLGDEEMACIAQGCLNLKRLCIRACPRLTDLGLLSLANGCPKLQKIKIRKCIAVTRFSISFLSENRSGVVVTYADRSLGDYGRRATAAAAIAAGIPIQEGGGVPNEDAVARDVNERGERWGFRAFEGLREIGRNARGGNALREGDRSRPRDGGARERERERGGIRERDREREREPNRLREALRHRFRRDENFMERLFGEEEGIRDVLVERERLRRALLFTTPRGAGDESETNQIDAPNPVIMEARDGNATPNETEAGNRNRLSRARMAFAAGTSYVAWTFRRLVGGNPETNLDTRSE